ncbi:MAG: excinuclease ABC subunit UvrC [Bacillota bacterium]|nr:excinuclease ABC subunit UvrC [Bacillota bacterium]
MSGERLERLERLRDLAGRVPAKPGVYLMKDAQGRVIYVGKAAVLPHRLRQYFQAPARLTPRTRAMLRQVADFEYIVTSNAVEALILEANLIKEHTPRYNVRLKDDKAYPFVRVSLDEPFPRLQVVRRRAKDGGRYFGPYADVGAMREALAILRRFFPVRSCRKPLLPGKPAERPCLNYHLGRCLGPCTGEVSPEEYRRAVEEACLFLEGRHDRLVPELRRRMAEAASTLEFERAARLRDQINVLERATERQAVVAPSSVEQDLVALAQAEGKRALAVVQVFQVRRGKLTGRAHFLLEEGLEREPGEILAAFLAQHYLEAGSVPREVLVGEELPEPELLAEYLSERRGGPVVVRVPRRGNARKLLAMAKENAETALSEELTRLAGEEALRAGAAMALAEALGLPDPPRRIECYDVSHTQGAETVGSLVVFEDGRPKASDYRRFRIHSVDGPDDCRSLREVIRRRFQRARQETAAGRERFARRPDLIVVDGGKGQLSAVREEMRLLGVDDIPTVGLAKEEEHLFRVGQSEPVILPAGSPALHLVQHLRDEAHRFAVSYHRDLRQKQVRGSVLDEVPGIGPRRKRELLRRFGSVAGLRRAGVEELSAVPGISRALAEKIWQTLHP